RKSHRAASARRGAAAGVGQHVRHRSPTRQARHEPVAELPRERLSLRAEAGDVERDRMLEVDEPVLAHLEADATRLAAERVVDLLAPQEPADRLDVLPKGLEPHGPLPEQAHAGVAGAEADEAPAWPQTGD